MRFLLRPTPRSPATADHRSRDGRIRHALPADRLTLSVAAY